jgi:molecular chaperone DnaK (HSP70)
MANDNNNNNDNNDAVNATANVTDAVKELAAMADRELRSDARKALADVEEAVGELMSIIEEQKAEIIRLTEERDEARRELCNRYYGRLNARGAANLRGWNCYKNQETT